MKTHHVHYLKRFLKSAAASSLYHSGVLDFMASRRLKSRAVVLMYHRVVPESRQTYYHSSPGIIVSDVIFRRHIEFIKRRFRVLNLEEFVHHIVRGTPFPDRSCLITFDDGWVDNYHTAFPILREFHVPATIFLPVDYIGANRMFWQEELTLRLTQLTDSSNNDDRHFVRSILNTNNNPNREQLLSYIQQLKRLGYAKIEETLQTVRFRQRGIELPEHDNRYINWQQVEEMSRHGVTFGSHCLSHRILTSLPEEEMQEEIIRSKSVLDAKLKNNIDTIAYPNGAFDEAVLSFAAKAKYSVGFSTVSGYVSASTPAYTVPRINIHGYSSRDEAALMGTLMGVFQRFAIR